MQMNGEILNQKEFKICKSHYNRKSTSFLYTSTENCAKKIVTAFLFFQVLYKHFLFIIN